MRSWQIAVPLALLLGSACWIAFTLGLPEQRMIGDRHGYDPGSRLLPLIAGTVLALASAWELARAARSGAAPRERQEEILPLLAAHVLVLVLLVASFRTVGFVLACSTALFVLIVLNRRAAGSPASISAMLAAAVALLACVTAIDALLGGAASGMFRLARTFDMELLREPVVHATVMAAALALAVAAAGAALRRLIGRGDLVGTVQVAVVTTFVIHIVFRQVFMVRLPEGLLSW